MPNIDWCLGLMIKSYHQKRPPQVETFKKVSWVPFMVLRTLKKLFIGLTIFFGTIHGSTVPFQLTFTFIYNIFSKKVFNFSKISGFQTYHKAAKKR